MRQTRSSPLGMHPGLPAVLVSDLELDQVSGWCRRELGCLSWSIEPDEPGLARLVFHDDDAWCWFRLTWLYDTG